MRDISINSSRDLFTKFISSSRSIKLKDILPWNISQMITKTIPISTRIVISYDYSAIIIAGKSSHSELLKIIAVLRCFWEIWEIAHYGVLILKICQPLFSILWTSSIIWILLVEHRMLLLKSSFFLQRKWHKIGRGQRKNAQCILA